MKKTVLILTLIICICNFDFNYQFNQVKKHNEFINLIDGRLIANEKFMKLNKTEKDSIIKTLKL